MSRKKSPAKMIFDQSFIEREAKRNGTEIDLPWVRHGGVFFSWVPVVHQMTLRELIDFMKMKLYDPENKGGINEILQSDEHWLRLTPMQLLHDAQLLMNGDQPFEGSVSNLVFPSALNLK